MLGRIPSRPARRERRTRGEAEETVMLRIFPVICRFAQLVSSGPFYPSLRFLIFLTLSFGGCGWSKDSVVAQDVANRLPPVDPAPVNSARLQKPESEPAKQSGSILDLVNYDVAP